MTFSIARLRELVIPLIMVVVVAFYLSDAIGLSREALIFPGALIAVIGATLLWSVVAAYLAPPTARGGTTPVAPTAVDAALEPVSGDQTEIGPILAPKPWLLVAIPVLLLALMDVLGALLALIVMVFAAQLALGARSLPMALLMALGVAVPIHGLFKYVLYVRFPVGVLGLG